MFNTGGYSLADISAATGGSNRNNDGLFGGNGAWIIIILFLFVFLGWGNRAFGGVGGNDGGGNMPTIVNLPTGGSSCSGEIQRGFDNQAVISKLDGITNGLCDGFYAQNTAIMNGFHGVDNAICNLGYQTQQGFNSTNVALMQGQNALQSQIASCCCDVREAIQGVNYNMAQNTCAMTNTMNNNTRDIIDSQNAGTRAILDYLCQDKISTLQAENQSLRFQASQTAQNQFITQVSSDIVNRLQPTPVPAYPAASPCGLGNWSPNVLANGYGYNTGCNGCNL